MAQLNPNFEIDFSDINSYEQIQLINDTQLAKENLLMHRAYKEPSDDAVIRNHFSSFTFVDFCPKIFPTSRHSPISGLPYSTATTSQPPPSSSSTTTNPIASTSSSSNNNTGSSTVRHYELESFSGLFERINVWLKLNKDWRVVSMETLIYDCRTQFNHLKSSIHSNYLPQNTRGLRLFLSPSKSRFSGPQRIGCINVVPRKISGSHLSKDQPPVYETLDQILNRLNELLLTRPIEGRILSVETITLPMVNGYVDTEANYFMDGRLNVLNQSIYSLAPMEGDKHFDLDEGHSLIDILRVYYEFGPMICGLVNLIDFLPRFYTQSPTTLISEQPEPSITTTTTTSQQADQQTSETTPTSIGIHIKKIAATESLTRLVRRSLAWFESERKRILTETDRPQEGCDPNAAQSQTVPTKHSHRAVNLKLCNLQVCHKVLLKDQLIQVDLGNLLDIVRTRTMSHEPIRYSVGDVACDQCALSTQKSDPKEWCSHLNNLVQPFEVRFIRLAYIVPVFNKYARSMSKPMRMLRRVRSEPSTGSNISDRIASATPTSSSSSTSSSATSTSTSKSTSPSESPTLSQRSATRKDLNEENEDDIEVVNENEHKLDNLSESLDELQIEDGEAEEWAKVAALAIVSGTNERHRSHVISYQLNQDEYDGLSDAPIGQLTYRLFAPCQLVNSSSCFAINPVNSSSPLARRGSVDLNGSGISSENANPSTALLSPGSTLSLNTESASSQQQVISFGAFFPAKSHDIAMDHSSGSLKSHQTANNASKFTTNEFESVDAIKRRMEIYVTTNSMKVVASETMIVNLSDALSCLSTAIEQTVIKASFGQRLPTTFVSVYILYAAVDKPQLPNQLLEQQKLRSLELIKEEIESDGKSVFDDNFKGSLDSSAAAAAKNDTLSSQQQQQPEMITPAPANNPNNNNPDDSIRIEQNPEDSSLTLYNCAYDRTVALPSQPENHFGTCLEPIELLGSKADCLWLNESELMHSQRPKSHSDPKNRKSERRKRKSARQNRHEDSQCSIM